MPITKERPRAQRTLTSASQLALFDVKACFAWAWSQCPDPPKARKAELLDAVVEGYYTGSVFRDADDPAAEVVYRLAIFAAYAEARDLRISRTSAAFPHVVLRTMEGQRCAVAAGQDGRCYRPSERPRLPFVGCDRFDCACSLRPLTAKQYSREFGQGPQDA